MEDYGGRGDSFGREDCALDPQSRRASVQAINNNPKAEYVVSEAVGFGDFLSDQARVQAADVGIC
jgi:hypothetical protein